MSSSYSQMGLYRRMLSHARPTLKLVPLLLLVHLVATPLALLSPVPLKIAVDSALGTEPVPSYLRALLPDAWAGPGTAQVVLVAAGLLVGIALLTQLQVLAASLLHTYTAEKMTLDFRARVFAQIQRLSLAYHDARGTADSVYRVQHDAASIQYIIIDGVVPFVTALATVTSMLYVTFRIDWHLALVAVTVAPFMLLLAPLYRRRLRDQAHHIKAHESTVLSVVQEVLSGIRIVKAFSQEPREQERFVHHSRESMGARVRFATATGSLGVLIGLTTAVAIAATLFVGVNDVRSQMLTVGELLLVMGYIARLYDPLNTIGKRFATLQSHLVSAERALSLFDVESEVPDGTEPLRRASGAVAFRNVCFAYDSRVPVLKDVSFRVAPGARVGIIGKTGVGKTTLVSLLMRFYDPTSGEILLDDRNIRDYKLKDVRDQFAIVLQEPILFSTSIGENIRYAGNNATDEAIVAAAKAAGAHKFITSLPEGYDTLVGERGVRLSGGERQRVSLARAFLKNAPILILDEPTSNIDVRTEKAIMSTMNRLMEGRTTFMIAHRVSTLERCDLLLEIDAGRIRSMRTDVAAAIEEVTKPPLQNPPANMRSRLA